MNTIYRIRNVINNKAYIGQTVNYPNRYNCHISTLRSGKHYNKHLQKSWNKYGEENFVFEIMVKDLPEKYLDDVERGLILTLKTMDPNYGFNRDTGGSKFKRQSPEAKEKMRQANIGRKHTPETVEKMRRVNLGRRLTDEQKLRQKGKGAGRTRTIETRLKMSAAQKGKKVSQETIDRLRSYNENRVVSKETSEKISKANTGRKHTQEAKDKIKAALTGKVRTPAHCENIRKGNLGKFVSEETRKKQSESQKRRYTRERSGINLGDDLSVRCE